jgi:hypothetical protein
MMNIKSFSIKDLATFKNQLLKEIELGFKPTLAICFSDASIDFEAISSYLTDMNIDTMGTTTCGEIYDGQSLEESCSVLLLELDRDLYHLELANFENGEDNAAKKIAQIALEKFSNPSIITYASMVGANGDRIVRGYKEILPRETPIFGGLAGDNFKNKKFTVFYNQNFETEGMVALILDGEKLKVEGTAYSGWKALGKTHIVTKADGNNLYEIDNKSALDLFIEYFGLEYASTSDGESLEMIPGTYPLKVINENETNYMRSPLFYDRKNGSLILAGELKNGDKVKFCPMPDIDTVYETVNHLKNYADTQKDISNSCAARKFAFGPMMGKEIQEIFDIWNVPTVGLMAMGEIGSYSRESECEFHNVTCSLVSITQIR